MFTKEQLLKGIKRSKAQQIKAFEKLQVIDVKLRNARTMAEANRLMKLDDKWREERHKAADSVDRLTRLMIEQGFTMTREESRKMMMSSDKDIKVTGDIMFAGNGRLQDAQNRKFFFKKSELIGIFIF